MFLLEKQLADFAAAHRITGGYQGKCRNLHGHNYAIRITLAAKDLNDYGFVMDFGDINQHFDGWLKAHLDHSTIISEEDEVLLKFVKEHQQKYLLLNNGKTTSVENLTLFIYEQFAHILGQLNEQHERNIVLYSVTINETATSQATYSPYGIAK